MQQGFEHAETGLDEHDSDKEGRVAAKDFDAAAEEEHEMDLSARVVEEKDWQESSFGDAHYSIAKKDCKAQKAKEERMV